MTTYLNYPQEVLDYIKSRQEQREFYKPRKPTDPPDTDIPILFNKRAETTVNELVPLLTKFKFTSVNFYLDIGCGFGATTALLARTLNVTNVYLIEGRGTPLKVTGFNQQVDAWNDVMLAAKMVETNVTKDRTKVNPYYYDELPKTFVPNGLDLITSFRSWGHHYPISTYLEHVKQWLKPGGALCLDVRISKVPHDIGLGALTNAGFEQLAWVSEKSASAKSKRMLFRYKP